MFAKNGAPYFQVNASALSETCIYSPISKIAGWWCCPHMSIPVEEVRGQRNMSFRLYKNIHDQCKDIISTQASPFVIRDAEMSTLTIIMVIIGVGAFVFSILTLIVCVTSHVKKRRSARAKAAKQAAAYFSSAPLIGSFGASVSAILSDSDNVTFQDLVTDVNEANAALSERIAKGRASAKANGAIFGRSCLTFRPGIQQNVGRAKRTSGAHLYLNVSENLERVEEETHMYDQAL